MVLFDDYSDNAILIKTFVFGYNRTKFRNHWFVKGSLVQMETTLCVVSSKK